MSKITIQLIEGGEWGWRADIKELLGFPPCGDGKTKEEAIANLFMRLRSTTGYMHGHSSVLDECRKIEIMEKEPSCSAVSCPLCEESPTLHTAGYEWEAWCRNCDIKVKTSSSILNNNSDEEWNLLKLVVIARWNIVCGNDKQREEARTIYDRLLKAYSEMDDRTSGDEND